MALDRIPNDILLLIVKRVTCKEVNFMSQCNTALYSALTGTNQTGTPIMADRHLGQASRHCTAWSCGMPGATLECTTDSIGGNDMVFELPTTDLPLHLSICQVTPAVYGWQAGLINMRFTFDWSVACDNLVVPPLGPCMDALKMVFHLPHYPELASHILVPRVGVALFSFFDHTALFKGIWWVDMEPFVASGARLHVRLEACPKLVRHSNKLLHVRSV